MTTEGTIECPECHWFAFCTDSEILLHMSYQHILALPEHHPVVRFV